MGGPINQPVLPLARITFLTNRGVGRDVAAEAAVHVDHVPFGDAKLPSGELHLVGIAGRPPTQFMPDENLVRLSDGSSVRYDYLVASAGLKLEWAA